MSTDLPTGDPSVSLTASTPSPAPKPQLVNRNSFARNVSIVAAAMAISRILGFVREIIMANRFGTSSDYDAYVSAFRIPDLLFLVIFSGAVGSAFIPVFNQFMVKDDEEKAWRLASSVITWTALLTIVLGVIGFIFADPLMRYVVAPDLPPEAHEAGVQMMRILLLSPLLLGFAIAAKGILEAQDLFTMPALAPILYNLTIIVAALAFAPRYGITAVAVGVVVGALLQAAAQVPALIRSGMEFHPSLNRHVEGLVAVASLLGPRIIGQAAFQINFIAVNHFATSLGEGRASGLNYAWQMMMVPNGIIALSVVTVVFPQLTRQFGLGDINGARATFQTAVRPMLFLVLPASILLLEFRTQIFQVFFQSGSFNATSIELSADPLAFLAAGLTFYALVELLARSFFAMQDARTPVVSGIIIIILNITGSYLLMDRFDSAGLAMMLSLSTAVEAAILLVVFQHKVGAFDSHFGAWGARLILAGAAMAVAGEATTSKITDVFTTADPSRLVQFLFLMAAITITGTTFLIAAALLGLDEIRQFSERIRRLIHK